ncbi:hypothetical protein S101395_00919 [Bacillus sonorensis]|uniref:Uncharacterized protein n=1 Tax=Bacillus sonorensis TaxID=119858 RepID=A0ABM6LE91_9BACI|nr:hypothetical protein S101395_00919 [Bacillus sonorensis]
MIFDLREPAISRDCYQHGKLHEATRSRGISLVVSGEKKSEALARLVYMIDKKEAAFSAASFFMRLHRVAFHPDDSVDRFNIIIDISYISLPVNPDFRFHDRKLFFWHIVDPDGVDPDVF